MPILIQAPTRGNKLDIGCGDAPRDGYCGIDRKFGSEAYPLKWSDGTAIADNSIDEIVASHVLEHFPYSLTLHVLKEWVRVLKPGGRLRVAVPDFDYIVSCYLNGSTERFEAYLFGGHTDKDDCHYAMFNLQKLRKLLLMAGVGEVQRWSSNIKDCASLPVSLNLLGTKGAAEFPNLKGVVGACFSVPRFGPTATMFKCMESFTKLQIGAIQKSGAFWGACLQGAMEIQVAAGHKYLLTLDYDSLFDPDDVLALYRLMEKYPEADFIAPIQSGRDRSSPLMTVAGPDGKARSMLSFDEMTPDLLEIRSAHFGLTMIRMESLMKMPKPWFMHAPDAEGGWGDGRIDDDTYFWAKARELGLKVFQANRIAIGHGQWMASFPDEQLQSRHIYVADYLNGGKPEGTWR